MTEREAHVAWAAGFLDGEGHVGINRIRDRRLVGGERAFRLNPRVTVGQIALEPLERLQGLFGGAIATRSMKANLPQHRQCYVWRLGGARQCAPFLRTLLPLLTVKRVEAELVLCLCDRIQTWRGGRLSENEVAMRNDIAMMLAGSKATGRGAAAVLA